MPPSQRTCARTGLALTSGPVRSFRIARESYGPLDPPKRKPGSAIAQWSRYDTPGHTIYSSAEEVIAFLELLAPYRTDVANERRALQPVADALGIPLDAYWKLVCDDWAAHGSVHPLWLPQVFREGREISELQYPEGWWIDISATETMNALPDIFESVDPGEGKRVEALTIAALTGDNREFTTMIASVLRENVQLDDGSLPMGIEFTSKHGHPSGATGRCWAYWMRDVDAGMSEPTRVLRRSPIEADNPAYLQAQALCKIRSR